MQDNNKKVSSFNSVVLNKTYKIYVLNYSNLESCDDIMPRYNTSLSIPYVEIDAVTMIGVTRHMQENTPHNAIVSEEMFASNLYHSGIATARLKHYLI